MHSRFDIIKILLQLLLWRKPMDKGRTQQIIDKMHRMVDNAQTVPLGNKVMLSRDEVNIMLTELEVIMDTELKKYRELTDKQARIINAAKQEAEDIIEEAEKTAHRLRKNYRNTVLPDLEYQSLEKDKKQALHNANDIYAASVIYTDEMLMEVNDVILHARETIQQEYETTLRSLDAKIETIQKNKGELMEDLDSLKEEERYQKILQISEVIAGELYAQRKKENEERRAEGIQLELNLVQEEIQKKNEIQ